MKKKIMNVTKNETKIGNTSSISLPVQVYEISLKVYCHEIKCYENNYTYNSQKQNVNYAEMKQNFIQYKEF